MSKSKCARTALFLIGLAGTCPLLAACGDDSDEGDDATAAEGMGSGDAGPDTDGTDPGGSAATDAGTGAGDGDGQPDDGDSATMVDVEPIATEPIDPPVADDCITDVSAGDHTFTCDGVTFLVMVDPICTERACGLIFDIHGGTMSGAQMRDNTHLHELAPPHGYLVVHPSATPNNTGGTWDFEAHAPILGDFMERMIAAFHINPDRVHVTGFSQGSAMTFWFLCHKNDLLASTAPISGQSASQITAPDGGNCIESIGPDWSPRVPILFMSGTLDTALVIEDSRARIDGLVERLELNEGEEVDGDDAFRRTRYEDGAGMVLDYLEHDYGGQAVLDGHCIPGGDDLEGGDNNFGVNATTCTTGEINIHWGEIALQWFLDHPRP